MFVSRKTIPLFWWSSIKFENKKQENFGDIIGPYLIKKICQKEVRFIQPKKRKLFQYFTKVYFTVGSILPHVDKKSIVWGSGLIDKNTNILNASFLAIRGPISRKILLKKGYSIPEVYGDPALLLPNFYSSYEKKIYKIGIIPHYVDYELVLNWYIDTPSIKIINLLNNSVEAVINEICSCETIISSSLHGIIVSHSYNIPAVWVKFSNNLFGDDIKFHDYFESVKISNISSTKFEEKKTKKELIRLIEQKSILINVEVIKSLQKGLMDVCPF
ncbi:polysaccharide pyruvyl transferase family protein [Lutibacter flavus]|uniref:Polysaccharide pyruvyl transferase n=1 Tax=Lutibacter flavus TaxID=691689 RepID=A0A238VQP7_9FLAO|nr:polysaccharide pyruvyl transferase family protein [Lutibacter flavus]SNR36548.1 Polysaccharide pyruvyl transferase [Lutibacter flavus]